MGLTFRGEKGSPLLHTELDNNFREFFYSASVSGSDLLMFRSRSLDNTVTLPLSYPKGGEYAIQLKKGNAPSGSGTSFSGSQNLIYDFRENTTKISGSLIISSSRVTTPFQVQGSGSITGDLTVGGKVIAEEFITEYSTVAVSTIYKSGSSKFGDTLDDTHTFIGAATITGSLTVSGSSTLRNIGLLEQTGSIKILGNTIQTGSTVQLGSLNIDGGLSIEGKTSFTGSTVQLGDQSLTGNQAINGNTFRTGSLSQTGQLTVTGGSTQIELESFRHTGEFRINGDTQMTGSLRLSGSLIVDPGFTLGDAEGNNQFILKGENKNTASSEILFADDPSEPGPFYNGMGIRYDSENNLMSFDSNDPPYRNSILTIDRLGNLTITGDAIISGSLILQNEEEDTVFTGSLVVTDRIEANSITGALDASNLVNIPYAVTASNTFFGDQYIVGDITASNLNINSNSVIEGNLTVNGTGSFAYIQSVTGSAKIIGDAFIVLNNNTPSERYAGVKIFDSGSAGVTASLQFDGFNNDWFYEYSDDGGVTTDHGVVLFGPEYSTIGTPTYPTNNTVQKGNGGHHLLDSNITDDGSTISLGSNVDVTGTLTATNDIVAFYSSDERLKDNIVPIENPIEKVKQIKGVEFDWNDKQEVYKGHDVGVIAQDVEKILPELVTTRDDGYKAVKYEKIIALLIEAVKDQQSQIDELKSKL